MITWVNFTTLADQYRVKRGTLDLWVQAGIVRTVVMRADHSAAAPQLGLVLQWSSHSPMNEELPTESGAWYALEDVVPLAEIDLIADAEARLDPEGVGTFGDDRPKIRRPGPQVYAPLRRAVTAPRKRHS